MGDISGKAGLAQSHAAPDQHRTTAALRPLAEVFGHLLVQALRSDVQIGNTLTEGGAKLENATILCLLKL